MAWRGRGFWRLLQCVAVVALLGPRTTISFAISGHDLRDHYGTIPKQDDLSYSHLRKALEVFHIEIDHTSLSRKLLQTSGSQSLCLWGDGECNARTIGLIPNEQIISFFTGLLVCDDITTMPACDAHNGCTWFDDSCSLDVTLFLVPCLVDEWLVFRRGAECDQLGSEEQCTLLKGCSWTGTVCLLNLDDLIEAIEANPTLQQAFATGFTCVKMDAGACVTPCEVNSSYGNCTFTPLFSTTNWFNGNDGTFCKFSKQYFTCQSANAPNCPENCDIRQGTDSAFCNINMESLVNIGYESDPALRDLMFSAIDACPTFTDEVSCTSFAG